MLPVMEKLTRIHASRTTHTRLAGGLSGFIFTGHDTRCEHRPTQVPILYVRLIRVVRGPHSDNAVSAYPIDSTSPKGWGRARCARSIFDHCTSLESSSVTRPPIGSHNDRLIKNVAPPRRTAMAASRYFSDWVASSNPQPTSNCT